MVMEPIMATSFDMRGKKSTGRRIDLRGRKRDGISVAEEMIRVLI
ncbi:hypothetical protein V8P78_03285 [Rhizobium sp. 6AS6]|uniref:Uncharacterized protein n=1 Tax=Rhizobium aouanii TaxID=3118145 RepID=A0ABU8CDB5_9HYPH